MSPATRRRITRILARETSALDQAVASFQRAQARIRPLPTTEEVQEMRRGEASLTPEAYLLGVLQRAVIGIEEVASEIRACAEDDTLDAVATFSLTPSDYNAIESALDDLHREGRS